MQSVQRAVRLFVSSTFRDFSAERERLQRFCFPALRCLCEERAVTFTDVDLRWGITEEQAAEGEVLPICLAEIDSSRPFFIGFLGERYGWVPATIAAELVAARLYVCTEARAEGFIPGSGPHDQANAGTRGRSR